MQQPSAQGIASLYRGNPQPLQQSIQKDQQAKPGLPPDLQKMLALQIVTNEKDSATAQKAMQQLQQMGGQQGKPPTVMQSLQQQAEQKLQAQAVQAEQKKQGIQGLMQQAPAAGVPEGTPQPEEQPQAQGIDQLPVEFAGAEGGIVSFAGENGSEVLDPVDEASQRTQQALEKLRTYGLRQRQQDPEGFSAAQQRYEQAQSDLASAERQATGGPAGAMGRSMTPPKPTLQPPAQDENNQSAAETARLQQQTSLPQAPAPVQAPARDIKELAAQRAPAPARAPAPVMEQPQAPVAQAPENKVMMDRVLADPAALAAAKKTRLDSELGAPETAQHDRLIAELEKRKQDLAPKQGYEGLMEFLSQISANTQPGRGSFASGAAGARGMDKLNNERKLEQFELSKQAIEVSQKKLDTVRAYAEKRFSIGESEFDKVYKEQFEAAKAVAENKAAAQKLAQENTLKLLEMQNQRQIAAGNNATSLAASGAQSESRFISDWMSKPENKGKSYADAYAAFKMAGNPSATNRGVMTRDQASDNVAKKLDISNPARKQTISDATQALQSAGISKPTLAQIEEHLIQEQIKGASVTGGASPATSAPSSGKVPPPPAGYKLNG